MALTAKQQRFVDEYLIDRDAMRAAIRAGFDWPSEPAGFYVYFLLEDQRIFYVGKGKGRRIEAHRHECLDFRACNQVKAERVRAAIQDETFAEHLFATGLSEPEALRLEKALIRRLRASGLTNISSGNVHPLESQIARINANLAAFRPFEEWERIAPEYARRFAIERHGSMRGLYDALRGQFIELRDEFEAKLKALQHA